MQQRTRISDECIVLGKRELFKMSRLSNQTVDKWNTQKGHTNFGLLFFHPFEDTMATLIDLWNKEPVDDMSNRKRVLRDSLVELMATAVFVYAGTLSVVSTGRKLVGQGGVEDVARILPIAMSFGISILAMAYSMGHISGGHMNPGVSLLAYFRRRISGQKMLCYWFCQFLGAIIGASLTWGSTSNLSGISKSNDDVVHRPPFDLGSTVLDDQLSQGNGFLLEFMGSFFFYFVIAQTALDKRGIGGTNFPAIPIGFICKWLIKCKKLVVVIVKRV